MSSRDEEQKSTLEEALWKEVATVEDPEIMLPLTELGLIYEIKVDEENVAQIKMTLTSMGCPMGAQLQSSVHAAATRVEGIKDAEVEVIWTPQWDPKEMASEDAQMHLGIY